MNTEAKAVPNTAKRPPKPEAEEEDAKPAAASKPGLLPTGLSRAIVLASLILSAIAVSLLFSHRYEVVAAHRGENAFIYRIDTLSGSISFCSSTSCVPVAETSSGG